MPNALRRLKHLTKDALSRWKGKPEYREYTGDAPLSPIGGKEFEIISRFGAVYGAVNHEAKVFQVQGSVLASTARAHHANKATKTTIETPAFSGDLVKRSGQGVVMYALLAKTAHKLGYELQSDGGVSAEAQHVWMALKRRDYDVRISRFKVGGTQSFKGGVGAVSTHLPSAGNLSSRGVFYIPAPKGGAWYSADARDYRLGHAEIEAINIAKTTGTVFDAMKCGEDGGPP